MSGGHFDYNQYKIGQIADEIEDLIFRNDSKENNEWEPGIHCGFKPETITEFRKGLQILREAQVYAHRIDWLVSCDDSEESFHERLEIDLAKLKETPNE